MLTALASSIAALSRMLPLGSPPPTRAAVVISRISLEKSLPRCWSFLAFFRLSCAHFECPDIPSPPFPRRRSPLSGDTGQSRSLPGRLRRQGRPQAAHALEPRRLALLGGLGVPLLGRRLRGHRQLAPARPPPHERQARPA